MTYDPTAAYRSAQVTTSSPAAQVVLLYEGAIRFASQSIARLDAGDVPGAHNASLRSQAIVSALRESLDLSAGDVASRLDSLYGFMLGRLVASNVAKDPGPTREVIALLRELLQAWRAIAATGAAAATPAATPIRAAASLAPGAPGSAALSVFQRSIPGAA